MGLYLLRPGGPSQMDLLWVSREQPPPPHPSLSKLAPTGPARSTPPHHPLSWSKGCLLEGFGLAGKAPLCLKASARRCLVSPLSLFLALLSTKKKRLWQRVGQFRRMGLTPHRSEHLKFCFVLISVNCSFESHRSFTAPMPFLHCLEGFSAAAIFF